HLTYETCSGDSCRNDSHFGYDCQPQFPLNYESEPGYIENYNSYLYDSSSFPQQELCCEDCEVLPEADHCQPPQYTVNYTIFNAHNDLFNANNDILNSQNKITIAQNKLMKQLTSMCAMVGQLIQKKQEEKQIEEEQAANARYWKIPACYDDDDDSAITPNEPVDSLSMRDEHLNTIPVTKSDEFIKSCVENLVPNPSESEGESECNMPARKEFTTFSNILFNADYELDSSDDQSCSDEDVPEKFLSNPLFEEEIIPIKIDQHHDNAESTHDSSLIISSKIDSLLDEFAEEFISENSNADIESFSPSPIPVEHNDSRMEKIDLSFNPDEPMLPSIEDDDDDSERDILIHKELLDNYSFSFPKNESFCFDIPSFSRPPAKPPDGNTGILNIKIRGDNFEQKVPMPRLMITRVSNQEKSPDLLSHRGLENFQLSAKCPIMIHGKNIPILDVPLFHFYLP
nr:hypothetical protein [Tanacetum cinerariifolium]